MLKTRGQRELCFVYNVLPKSHLVPFSCCWGVYCVLPEWNRNIYLYSSISIFILPSNIDTRTNIILMAYKADRLQRLSIGLMQVDIFASKFCLLVAMSYSSFGDHFTCLYQKVVPNVIILPSKLLLHRLLTVLVIQNVLILLCWSVQCKASIFKLQFFLFSSCFCMVNMCMSHAHIVELKIMAALCPVLDTFRL